MSEQNRTYEQIEEITLHFGKGTVEPFTAKDGREMLKIMIPMQTAVIISPGQASCFRQKQSMRTSMAKDSGQRFLRMVIQLLPCRIWLVRAKTVRISGRMRRRPAATVS